MNQAVGPLQRDLWPRNLTWSGRHVLCCCPVVCVERVRDRISVSLRLPYAFVSVYGMFMH